MAKGKKKGGGGGGGGKKKSATDRSLDRHTKKVIADKTFGMKNKNKSKRVQQDIRTMQKSAEARADAHRKKNPTNVPKKGTREDRAKQALMLGQLFNVEKTVKQVVLKEGQDPKTVLCAYFKAGSCKKGLKCKFSHDKNVGRLGAKRDLYKDEKKKETSEDWTEEELRDAVNKKGKGRKIQSAITCKHFLDAVQNHKYGWFWECPSGPTCHYTHALPEGFVFSKKKAALEDDENQEALCDILEAERAKLTGPGTPVTLERFLEWKKKRAEIRAQRESEAAKRRAQELKAGKGAAMSGREMFSFKPELFTGDEGGDEDIDLMALKREKDAQEEADDQMEIDESLFE